MNKKELVAAVAAKTKQTQPAAAKSLDAVLESIGEALVKGEKVPLIGFGTFSISQRAARMGRNPQTGKKIKIKAKKVVKFTPGKPLKESVDK